MTSIELRKEIDYCLKQYGVDWKLSDDGKHQDYYEALLDELEIVIERANIKGII